MRGTGQAGFELIKYFEGLRLQAYLCSAGVPTIGYGSTKGVTLGMTITKQEAEDLLRRDLHLAERSVLRLVTVPLNDNQFDALVSFVFNVGGGALQRSTLRQKLNRREYWNVPSELLKWCRAGGKRSAGLLRRRQAEAELFMA
jgi:lysozyme